jgi:hypothetical protein
VPRASARSSSGVVDIRSPEATAGKSVRVMASVKCRSSVKISNPSGSAPNQSAGCPWAVRSALRSRHTPAIWLLMIILLSSRFPFAGANTSEPQEKSMRAMRLLHRTHAKTVWLGWSYD